MVRENIFRSASDFKIGAFQDREQFLEAVGKPKNYKFA